MSNFLTTHVKLLAKLRKRKTEIAADEKAVNKAITKLETGDIADYMTDQEIDDSTIAGIGKIFLKTEIFGYVKAEDREKFHAWLTENGNEAMIKPAVNAKTLNAFVKEQLEAGEDLPDWIKVTFVPTAKLRRVKNG